MGERRATAGGDGGRPATSTTRASAASSRRGRAPNKAVPGVIKFLAKVKVSSAPMWWQPASDPSSAGPEVVPRRGGGPSRLLRGRYVIVQSVPGRIRDCYWVDPDLASMGRRDFLKRCKDQGASRRELALIRRAAAGIYARGNAYAEHPRHEQIKCRGWVHRRYLEPVGSWRAIDRGRDRTPSGNAAPPSGAGNVALLRRPLDMAVAAASPGLDELYPKKGRVDPSTGRVSGASTLKTYGVFNEHTYVSYNTVRGPPRKLNGYVHGYLRAGQDFKAVAVARVPVWRLSGTTWRPTRAAWYYGYGRMNGLPLRAMGAWGWVPAACLERR